MGQDINAIFRTAAKEFAGRVRASLGDQVDSIVVYGSTARGEARSDSDVDILVISGDADMTRDELSQMLADFTYERNYAFFLSLAHYGREEFSRFRERGSPFIDEVVREGEVLYDNGTFSRIREGSARVGG